MSQGQPKPESSYPRLEGDALFSWAQLMVEEQRLIQTKQQLAEQFLTELGYQPGEYLLANDGYIVTQDQAREAQEKNRIRTIPVSPSSRKSDVRSAGQD